MHERSAMVFYAQVTRRRCCERFAPTYHHLFSSIVTSIVDFDPRRSFGTNVAPGSVTCRRRSSSRWPIVNFLITSSVVQCRDIIVDLRTFAQFVGCCRNCTNRMPQSVNKCFSSFTLLPRNQLQLCRKPVSQTGHHARLILCYWRVFVYLVIIMMIIILLFFQKKKELTTFLAGPLHLVSKAFTTHVWSCD